MTQQLTYTPADPAGVASVDRLRLWDNEDRAGAAVVDVGPADAIAGAWVFTFADQPDGTYYSSVTVTYADSLVADDADDVITLPLAAPAQPGDPVGLWVTAEALADNADLADSTPEQRAAAARTASDVLYALSGRRWPGARIERLRLAPQAGTVRWGMPSPFGTSGPRRPGCACHSNRLDPQLPGAITRVVRLTVADTDVPAAQVEVLDQRVIRVIPGSDPALDPLAVNRYVTLDGDAYSLFPGAVACCGNTATVELVVEWGTLPPASGLLAALALATEICKGLIGGDCQIAGNITSVNRQGVSVLLDPNEFLKEGRTGVPAVDLWLAAVNPNNLAAGAEVWWPESPTPERLA